MINPELAMATPIILEHGMSSDEIQSEWINLQVRATATAEFIAGQIGQDEWEQVLDATGVDVIQLDKDWKAGLVYL
jgi:hypothetical protein